jgi:hypothetical protein
MKDKRSQSEWMRAGVTPQRVYADRRFEKLVLDPPSFEPGSWRGAGNCTRDEDSGVFWLVTRPRTRKLRGYAFEIYRSENGEDFSLRHTTSREALSALLNQEVLSIEGQQLLRDPLTAKYFLYVAVDIGHAWQTALLSSGDPCGPWKSEGTVIPRDQTYDSVEARDAVISFVQGQYVALYKASDGTKVNAALAVSPNGRNWHKLGLLRIDGRPQPAPHLLSGNIMDARPGPLFVGFESVDVVKGAAVSRKFVSYLVDLKSTNLVPVFSTIWKPLSPYERTDFPIHSYSDLVPDPDRNRLLFYVEAIDPRYSVEVGLNLEVDRVLLYSIGTLTGGVKASGDSIS